MSGYRVTNRGSVKRVHREGCRYGKHPYHWANDYENDADLLAALEHAGGVMWHVGCERCCPDLAARLDLAQRRHTAAIVFAHVAERQQ